MLVIVAAAGLAGFVLGLRLGLFGLMVMAPLVAGLGAFAVGGGWAVRLGMAFATVGAFELAAFASMAARHLLATREPPVVEAEEAKAAGRDRADAGRHDGALQR